MHGPWEPAAGMLGSGPAQVFPSCDKMTSDCSGHNRTVCCFIIPKCSAGKHPSMETSKNFFLVLGS